MLTPAFDLSQDPDFLTIAIRVPYARVSEFDVYFKGVDFKFYAKPYFLRLTLPGRIIENGSEQGSYDADKGLFTIQLPKETPGQHFEGLNMLTALLAPRKSRTAKPLVEEIGTSSVSEEGGEYDDEEFDWEIEQFPYEEVSESALKLQCHYGFGDLRSGVFQRLQDEFSDVIDIKDPDFTPAAERRQKRLAAELTKFDPDHYLADFFEDEAVEQVLKYNAWWTDTYSKIMAPLGKSQEQEDHAALVSFSEEEKFQLRKFVNKSYLLDKRAHRQVYYSLIDILLAYCYETRVTEGERNVESAWNIRKLSPTLCWFETWTNVHEILVAFGRRVLCYPLYRHFKLVLKAYRDTTEILQLGKSAVLKCLLDVHKIFQESDPAYILNDLYISDYCVWIQKAKSKKLAALAEALEEVSLTKAQLGLELEELEAAALLVQEEEAALTAAHSTPRQQTPPSGSEAGALEEPDSSIPSETEDSGSEPEVLKARKSKTVSSLRGLFIEDSSALLVNHDGVCREVALLGSDASQEKPLASAWAPGGSRPLIEELEEH
ncbi:SHQ1, H/ACA ribonucleoprotein assembly factor [Rhinolophus ferrumequinum]|uniref:Protein SHQ1 homolog n=1 Tax=Rhinolophus ferrumequinum TaxID=59479 RepID=A0A671FJ85_RHIFE|nr:protein SHQ1 homolog isoform X1 [Rhinolophus ferrumequinum]KAF6313490.1 SHQ1, H/ACA ribonucleoprotein assembly factor [Rhinolophus ferrumequinum]